MKVIIFLCELILCIIFPPLILVYIIAGAMAAEDEKKRQSMNRRSHFE